MDSCPLTNLTSQHRQDSLLQVHDGVVPTLVSVHIPVIVQTNNDIVTQLVTLLKQCNMANMKDVKSSGSIHHCVIGLALIGNRVYTLSIGYTHCEVLYMVLNYSNATGMRCINQCMYYTVTFLNHGICLLSGHVHFVCPIS